jgi:hypothetical protein
MSARSVRMSARFCARDVLFAGAYIRPPLRMILVQSVFLPAPAIAGFFKLLGAADDQPA